MAMPACPECGTTLTFLVCGSGEHPTLYRCMLCRELFFGIESQTRSKPGVRGPGRYDLRRPAPSAAHDSLPG